jgi:hypothetical protein
MADESQKLLDYILHHYVLHDEMVAIDLDASASDLGQSIRENKEEVAQREVRRADDLSDAFAAGLARAGQLRTGGQAELVLDDRKPDENRMADALIDFLVSYQLASSQTQETEPGHYLYRIAVDWDQLGKVAQAAGIDLSRAVGQR